MLVLYIFENNLWAASNLKLLLLVKLIFLYGINKYYSLMQLVCVIFIYNSIFFLDCSSFLPTVLHKFEIQFLKIILAVYLLVFLFENIFIVLSFEL